MGSVNLLSRCNMPVPPQIPIVSFLSPNKADRGLIEFWNTETANYVALDIGAPHPNTRDYAGFRLGLQQALPNNEKWIKRVWVSNETAPDWFNAQLKYAAEANLFPVYLRTYREEKKTYAPRTKLQPLTAVIGLTLVLAGDSYPVGSLPALTFAGGGGSGAAGHGVVNHDGTLAELVLDAVGTGYTSAPTFTIAPPPTGTTATGVALLQPSTALLVAEQANEFPPTSEFYGLYFDVTRVYETLPGFLLSGQNFDKSLDIVIEYHKQRTVSGAALGNARSEVSPVDSNTDEVTTPIAPIAALDAYSRKLGGYTNVAPLLPNILESVTVVLGDTDVADGSHGTTGGASSSGTPPLGYSLSGSSSASSSRGFHPKLIPTITAPQDRNVPCTNYIFFLPAPTTVAQILTKLTALAGATVNAWPTFKPRADVIILQGMKAEVRADASAQVSYSLTSHSTSQSSVTGLGSSKNINLVMESVNLPPTVHGLITLSGATSGTANATASADSRTSGTVSGGGTKSDTATAAWSITPTSLPATNGDTAIPSSGLYVSRIESDSYDWAYVMLHCTVLDAANL